MLMMCIQVKILRRVSCCFVQSIIFLHTVIYLCTLLRNIKCVLYMQGFEYLINSVIPSLNRGISWQLNAHDKAWIGVSRQIDLDS